MVSNLLSSRLRKKLGGGEQQFIPFLKDLHIRIVLFLKVMINIFIFMIKIKNKRRIIRIDDIECLDFYGRKRMKN